MLPIAELPFLAERKILSQIELKIVADQDRQDCPQQEMQAKYGADYARNIKLYFEQLAERK